MSRRNRRVRSLPLVLLALAPGFAGAARAQSVPAIVQQFGLIGTWSLDCSKPASPENGRSTYMVAGDWTAQSSRTAMPFRSSREAG